MPVAQPAYRLLATGAGIPERMSFLSHRSEHENSIDNHDPLYSRLRFQTTADQKEREPWDGEDQHVNNKS
jgi:hypothetical protein